MAEMVLGPSVTVELIRSMRAEGFVPTSDYIVGLAQTIGELWTEVELSENGRFEFEIFSPPLRLEFSLLEGDVEPVAIDDSLEGQRQLRKRQEALFRLLDQDVETQTIVDLGRVKTRIASPLEINAAGLAVWNDYIDQIEAGECVLAELKRKLRNYVLDLENQIGYRIGSDRLSQLFNGEIAIPELANKKIMVVDFFLFTVDREPIAVSEDTAGCTYYLDGDGRVPVSEHKNMRKRTIARAREGQHVSFADNKEDEIKNADLLARNKRFNAKEYPLFFDDIIRFEIMGEKVDRCKRSLPRAHKATKKGAE
jgi:hypothetical protein